MLPAADDGRSPPRAGDRPAAAMVPGSLLARSLLASEASGPPGSAATPKFDWTAPGARSSDGVLSTMATRAFQRRRDLPGEEPSP